MPKAADVTKPSATDRGAIAGRPLEREHRRLPDVEEATMAFMAADLPWLAPEAREALAATAELHGQLEDEVSQPSAQKARR